jgi:multisubunit Na+/H+ antiporter MnhE subunit
MRKDYPGTRVGKPRGVRLVVTWLALFWLWLLLAGEWNEQELIAAAGAATVASLFVRRWTAARVARPWGVPAAIVVDFGVLMWALVRSLVRREVVRGEFVRRPVQVEGDGARAWLGLLATYSPNAYIVGFDRTRQVVLLHDLVRRRPSERPV